MSDYHIRNYPSGWRPQDREPDSFICDDCRREHRDEGPYACEHTNCYRDLCVGCAYECDDCELTFCRQHVIEQPAANGMATRRCFACAAAAQKKEAA